MKALGKKSCKYMRILDFNNPDAMGVDAERVIDALMRAGFHPVRDQQSYSRNPKYRDVQEKWPGVKYTKDGLMIYLELDHDDPNRMTEVRVPFDGYISAKSVEQLKMQFGIKLAQ